MRTTLLITSLLLGCAATAAAQRPSRFALGPVAQFAHAWFDGHTDGALTVAGVAASVRVSRAISLEGELTSPGREITRSYEGTFVSYIPSPTPNPSLAEFDRWAPTARRTFEFDPGVGGTGMVVGRAPVHPRVTLAGRLGVSARRYTESSRFVVTRIPEGVDPTRVERDFAAQTVETIRGGMLVGVDADVALTRRFTVAPQVRIVYSGPSGFGNEYRELGLGITGRWQF
jgi:hypothetical protein